MRIVEIDNIKEYQYIISVKNNLVDDEKQYIDSMEYINTMDKVMNRLERNGVGYITEIQ